MEYMARRKCHHCVSGCRDCVRAIARSPNKQPAPMERGLHSGEEPQEVPMDDARRIPLTPAPVSYTHLTLPTILRV